MRTWAWHRLDCQRGGGVLAAVFAGRDSGADLAESCVNYAVNEHIRRSVVVGDDDAVAPPTLENGVLCCGFGAAILDVVQFFSRVSVGSAWVVPCQRTNRWGRSAVRPHRLIQGLVAGAHTLQTTPSRMTPPVSIASTATAAKRTRSAALPLVTPPKKVVPSTSWRSHPMLRSGWPAVNSRMRSSPLGESSGIG